MKYLLMFLMILPLSCVREREKPQPLLSPTNAIYFWKTRFELNNYEQDFLNRHDIRRMYVRFFDVDVNHPLSEVTPIATTSFKSGKPSGVEIVPTVFITTDALRMARQEEGGIPALSEKIITRVLNMADYHDLGPVGEIQLDCDWTGETKALFYELCGRAKENLREKGIVLSATIRLHQLRQTPPPVDRGVLMLYNTGALRSAASENSILSAGDVKAYLKRKMSYGLPLDFAYPTFAWGVWFRGKEFKGLLHKTEFDDSLYYSESQDGYITVSHYRGLEGHLLYPGDRIRTEHSEIKTITAVKSLVEKSFRKPAHSNILFHLDSTNLSRYTDHEIQSIFAH